MQESNVRRRGNGEGSLYFDKKRGRWRGAVAWTDPDGQTHRKSITGTGYADIRRKVAAVRSELDAGRKPASAQTVASYLTGWLDAERARVRPATWRYRDGHVRLYLIPTLGATKLANLAPRDVERMTSAMVERGLSPTTAAGCRTTLRKALADAVRDGLVHRNVAALARPPRQPGREVEYLNRDELRSLLEATDAEPLGPLVALAATTGLRQGELLGLAWSDVDSKVGTITVRRAMARSWDGYALAEPKTSRSRRTIHLPARAADALDHQRSRQAVARDAIGSDWQGVDNLVFTDAIGRPLKASDVSHGFGDLLVRAGIRHVPFHALRHSWATLALASGVPLKVIADNLGHASIAVTAAFYSGIVPELNRDAADAIGRALA